MQKIKFIPSFHFWDKVNFRILWPDWPHPFLTMSFHSQIFFDQLLIYVNLYQHARNRLFFIDLLWRYDFQTFWSVFLEPTFSQILDLCSNTTNHVNVHFRINSMKKLLTEWQHFSINSKKPVFPKKFGSVTHKFIWVFSTMPKFRKN